MKYFKMNKRMGLGVIIIALALAMTACGMHHGSHRMDQAKIMKRITKKLDLNEIQQGKLQVVLENASSFRQGMQTNHSELTGSLHKGLNASRLDVDALNMQFDEIESEFTTFRKAMLVDFAEFHNSLDETQREKLATKLEKMNRRH